MPDGAGTNRDSPSRPSGTGAAAVELADLGVGDVHAGEVAGARIADLREQVEGDMASLRDARHQPIGVFGPESVVGAIGLGLDERGERAIRAGTAVVRRPELPLLDPRPRHQDVEVRPGRLGYEHAVREPGEAEHLAEAGLGRRLVLRLVVEAIQPVHSSTVKGLASRSGRIDAADSSSPPVPASTAAPSDDAHAPFDTRRKAR